MEKSGIQLPESSLLSWRRVDLRVSASLQRVRGAGQHGQDLGALGKQGCLAKAAAAGWGCHQQN